MANSGQSFREFQQAGWEESSVVTKYHEHVAGVASAASDAGVSSVRITSHRERVPHPSQWHRT